MEREFGYQDQTDISPPRRMYFSDRPRIETVFLYIRQSTDERAERQVRSLADQRRDCETLAERLGVEIIEVFSEDRSARRPHNRPVFKEMLRRLKLRDPKKRRAQGILAWHPDRLSRNALEAGMIIQMLDDEQIQDMIFPAYAFHNDPSGKEHLFIEFARAKGYTDRLSQVVLRGVTSRERDGAMVYPTKFGYKKRREIPENPRLCSLFPIPDETTFPIIQRIFALRLDGFSVQDICDRMRRESPDALPVSFSKSGVSRWLADPFYHGCWIVKRGKKDERRIDMTTMSLPDGTTFTPVVDEAAFLRCQNRAAQGPVKRMTKRINPIATRIGCGVCGGYLNPATRSIKRMDGREAQLGYECNAKMAEGAPCRQPRVKASLIFHFVADALRAAKLRKREHHQFLIGMDSWLREKKRADQEEQSTLSRRASALTKKRADLIRRKAAFLEAGEYGPTERSVIEGDLAAVEKDLKQTDARRGAMTSDADFSQMRFRKFLELAQTLDGIWLQADASKKRAISEKLILNLTVEGREIGSIRWAEPFSTWLNRSKVSCGGGAGTSLEPLLSPLWEAVQGGFDVESWEWLIPENLADEAA